MKKFTFSIFLSSILFSAQSKSMNPNWPNNFWQKLPGVAFYWCDSLAAGYRYAMASKKDEKYKQELKRSSKTRATLEKLALVAEHPTPSQQKIDKYLSQLPEKEQNVVRRLGLKPAALRWQLNHYQNQKEMYKSASSLLRKQREDDQTKIIINTLALVLGSFDESWI